MSVRVLDASVAVAWYLPSQATPLTEVLKLEQTSSWRVPACFPYEVANVLLRRERRGAAPAGVAEVMLADLEALGVTVEPRPEVYEIAAAIALARKHSLVIFDAFYLLLTMRLRVQLVTRDGMLAVAAGREGCAVYDLRGSR